MSHLSFTGQFGKLFFIISPTKLGRFWRNLARGLLNKFAAKSLKRFYLTWIMSPVCKETHLGILGKSQCPRLRLLGVMIWCGNLRATYTLKSLSDIQHQNIKKIFHKKVKREKIGEQNKNYPRIPGIRLELRWESLISFYNSTVASVIRTLSHVHRCRSRGTAGALFSFLFLCESDIR